MGRKKNKTVQLFFEEVIILHELGDKEDEGMNGRVKLDNANFTRQTKEDDYLKKKMYLVYLLMLQTLLYEKKLFLYLLTIHKNCSQNH